jgi:hypothetical protein
VPNHPLSSDSVTGNLALPSHFTVYAAKKLRGHIKTRLASYEATLGSSLCPTYEEDPSSSSSSSTTTNANANGNANAAGLTLSVSYADTRHLPMHHRFLCSEMKRLQFVLSKLRQEIHRYGKEEK